MKNDWRSKEPPLLFIHCSTSIHELVLQDHWAEGKWPWLCTKVIQRRPAVRSTDPQPGSNKQKVNTVHKSITHRWEKLTAPRDHQFPSNSGDPSFWQPNHRQLIGYGGEGDLHINNSPLCETTLEHTVQQAERCISQMEMNLSWVVSSSSAPSVLVDVSSFLPPSLPALVHHHQLLIHFN